MSIAELAQTGLKPGINLRRAYVVDPPFDHFPAGTPGDSSRGLPSGELSRGLASGDDRRDPFPGELAPDLSLEEPRPNFSPADLRPDPSPGVSPGLSPGLSPRTSGPSPRTSGLSPRLTSGLRSGFSRGLGAAEPEADFDPPALEPAPTRLGAAPLTLATRQQPSTTVPARRLPLPSTPTEAEAAVHHFANSCVEVVNGYRPAAHLQKLAQPREAPTVIAQALIAAQRVAADRQDAHQSPRRRPPSPVALVHMTTCEPHPSAIEAAVVLVSPERTWALAFRLEHITNRWLATTMRLV